MNIAIEIVTKIATLGLMFLMVHAIYDYAKNGVNLRTFKGLVFVLFADLCMLAYAQL